MNPPVQPDFSGDTPLRSKLFSKYGAWSGVAQHYPVFSQSWYKYRLLSYILPIILIALFLGLSIFVVPPSNARPKFFLAIAFFWFSIVSALLVGRGLAVIVVKLNWPERKVDIGIVLAILIGVVFAMALIQTEQHLERQFASEYIQELKQKKQTDLVLVDTDNMSRNSPVFFATKKLLTLLIYLWLGGILDLMTYFRQRQAMQDLLVEQKVALYQKERNEAELRLSVLASQIEPHFLFNTLSGVRSAILTDPEMGVAIIDKLAEYLRVTIPQLRNDGTRMQVTLSSQMQAIRAYLSVIKFRIPRLTFSVEFDPSLSEMLIPPLMLISLVENAVKHGIELKKGPVQIAVTAEKLGMGDDERLVLTVSDDGLGFTDIISGSGIGLMNIRERLRQLYQEQAKLSLETNHQGGVTACITLPVRSLE